MTAEFAVLLPGLVLLLGAVVAAGVVAGAQVRCVDAARSAARLAARHESGSAVLAAAHAAGPAGTAVGVSTSGGLVAVRVRATVTLPLPGHPRLGLGAASTARLEDVGAESDG